MDRHITELETSPSGILCGLTVDWPDADPRSADTNLLHVYIVRDGQICEIRRYDDGISAAEAAGLSNVAPPLYRTGKICYLGMPALDVHVWAAFYEHAFGWNVWFRDTGRPSCADTTGGVSGAWVTDRKPDPDPVAGPLPVERRPLELPLGVHRMGQGPPSRYAVVDRSGLEVVRKV